jgi:DNA-nicking Smr family endonuclease
MGKKDQPFNSPFAELGKKLKKDLKAQRKLNAPPPPPPPPPKPAAEPIEDFGRAMSGAVPLDQDPRGRVREPLPPDSAEHLEIYDEDAEALAALASLVDGSGAFDISDSDEFIEGSVEGLDRRVLRSLKRGDYAVHGHIDLHGMTSEQAKESVEKFIQESRRNNRRCVLIVHGRGLHSKDQIPVLKSRLKTWLERGRIARSILAFSTARPHDGGAGAVYVLLRR